MKKLIILAAAFLFLSCSFQHRLKSHGFKRDKVHFKGVDGKKHKINLWYKQ